MNLKKGILAFTLASLILGCSATKKSVKVIAPEEQIETTTKSPLEGLEIVFSPYVVPPLESTVDLENKNKDYEYITYGTITTIYDFEKRLQSDSIIKELQNLKQDEAYTTLWRSYVDPTHFSRAQIQPQIKRYNFYGVPWAAYIIHDFPKLTLSQKQDLDPLNAAIFTNEAFGGPEHSYIAIFSDAISNWINIVKETPELKKYVDSLDLHYIHHNNELYLPLKPGSENIGEALLAGQKSCQPRIVYDMDIVDDSIVFDIDNPKSMPNAQLIKKDHVEFIILNFKNKEFYTKPVNRKKSNK